MKRDDEAVFRTSGTKAPGLFDQKLLREMKDAQIAMAYLNAALESGNEVAFRLTLRHFIEAQGGTKPFSRRTGLDAHDIYRMVFTSGNLRIEHLMGIGRAFGHRLAFASVSPPRSSSRPEPSWRVQERRIQEVISSHDVDLPTMARLPISIFDNALSPAIRGRLEKSGIQTVLDLALMDRDAVVRSCRLNDADELETILAINLFSSAAWDRARVRSWKMIDLLGAAATRLEGTALWDRPIEESLSKLPRRVLNTLKRAQCQTLSQVMRKSIHEMDIVPYFGPVARDAIMWNLAAWLSREPGGSAPQMS